MTRYASLDKKSFHAIYVRGYTEGVRKPLGKGVLNDDAVVR